MHSEVERRGGEGEEIDAKPPQNMRVQAQMPPLQVHVLHSTFLEVPSTQLSLLGTDTIGGDVGAGLERVHEQDDDDDADDD